MKTLVHNPLKTYSGQLIELFQQALTKPEAALFLHKKDARNILFLAESIVRLLNKIYDDQEFEEALKSFKKLEDLLGGIDHYQKLQHQFSNNKAINKAQQYYFTKKRILALDKLEIKLGKKDFYQDVFNRTLVLKINLNNKILVEKMKAQMVKDFNKIFVFFKTFPVKFTDLESQVHEIRRNLRWISIYCQSLKGVVVIKADHNSSDWEKKLIPRYSEKSVYNKVPVKHGLSSYIVLNQKAFYALNFLIDRLGGIKDKGLTIEALAKSIKKTRINDSKNPSKEALKQLKLEYTEDDLLKTAHLILTDFFTTNKIHEKLFAE